MSPLMKLYITDIDYRITPQHIKNVFYNLNIATIKHVSLTPYYKQIYNDYICYQSAYIVIDEWHDSEDAYNFIQQIKCPYQEARIIYDKIDEASWWTVTSGEELKENNDYELQ
jgi:hypothetical protein